MKINEIIVEGWFWPSKEEREAEIKLDKEKKEQEERYKDKEKKYFAHLALNGAGTGQEKDDWERLWRKYGTGPERMSHVDRERYERMYKQDYLALKAEIQKKQLQDPRNQKAHERAQIQARYTTLKKKVNLLSHEKKLMQDLFNQGAR